MVVAGLWQVLPGLTSQSKGRFARWQLWCFRFIQSSVLLLSSFTGKTPLTVTLGTFMIVSISMRHYMSISHLSAVQLFAEKCRAIEDSPDSDYYQIHKEQLSYSISAVIMAAAFLEATINEFYCDSTCSIGATRLPDAIHRDLLAKLWSRGIPRTASYSITEKYDIALEMLGKPPFNTNANPFQDVKLLVDLRNTLIHYEPETVSSDPEIDSKKIKKLHARFRDKFAINKIAPPGALFYPDKMLGAGCANWAKTSVITYADAFFNSLELERPYSSLLN